MTVAVDLFNPDNNGRTEGQMWSIDAATFSEVHSSPRVLADSQNFIVYSTKKRNMLRVVSRANLNKGSMRAHTAPVNAMKFVNYRSNVVASSAEGEFFVWVVTDETNNAAPGTARLTVSVYFKLMDPVNIRCFSFFINAENRKPDLLLLYDKQAVILESSVLISRFENEPLEATLQKNSTPIRSLGAVEERCLCSVGSGGWFAFTTEPTMVAACTLQNRSTPSWVCCEGSVVEALHLLDTPREETTIFVAASSNAVYQWTLTGIAEPSLIRKFFITGNIVVMESSRETFAVFDDQQQLALVAMESPTKYTCTHYSMPCQVRKGGVCLNRIGTEQSSCVLVDKPDRLTVFHLKGQATDASSAANNSGKAEPIKTTVTPLATAAVASTKEANPSPTAKALPRATGSVAANLLHQLGLKTSQTPKKSAAPQQRTSPYGHGGGSRPVTAGLSASGSNLHGTAAATEHGAALNAQSTRCNNNDDNNNNDNAATTTISTATPTNNTTINNNTANTTTTTTSSNAAPVAAASRPALHNASLPQAPIDGVLAAAVHQSEDDVRQSLERLQSAMANTSQILQLVPDTIRRDHEQLLNLSLEAQMTELQQKINFSAGLGDSANANDGAGGADASMFNMYALLMLMTPLSANIANGVARGVEEGLTIHLDHEVRHAIGNRLRATQKQIIKARLDDALKESTSHFVTQVEQAVQSVVKRELVEALSSINGTVTALVNENSRLQSELNAIMSCGVVEELRRTREELSALRETVAKKQNTANGALQTSAFAARRPSAETILSTVQSLLRSERYRQGLEYLAEAGHPPLVLQLLAALNRESENEQLYSALIEDTATPGEVWCRVLALLAEAAAAPGTAVEEREAAAAIAVDVLSEREQLLQNSARGGKLTKALMDFAKQARADIRSVPGLQCLKNLEKLLQ